jgi:3-methyladenine DNA glycosylase/8-oxoguanine DNA glycosylase
VVQLAGAEFPRAEALVRLSSAQLRACGLSAAKVRSLQDLASRTLDGRLRLERAGRLADEELVEHVTQVHGIGPWTVHMFLLFRLGRLDVGASGDMGVQEGLRYLDGLAERPTPAQALRRMERWRPLRSVGCWYMWRLLDAERAAVKRT